MSDIWIGIDPGAKGAICILNPGGLINFIDLSERPRLIAQQLNHFKLNNEIQDVYIEDVHSLYGMSAKSNFTFGWNVGMPHTIFDCLNIPLKKVQPKVWQKHVGVTAKNSKENKNAIKQNVASLCAKHYPAANLYTPRGRLLDGRSDALMIAYYGYLLHLQERKET